MRKIKNRHPLLRFSLLPLALACASAQAGVFSYGELEGSFDSQLSVGFSWSMENPDKKLIGANNGGEGALSSAGDDGRLNYRRGDAFSKIFKGIHELELRYRDTGLFMRGKYWYDYALEKDTPRFKELDDSGRKPAAKGSGAELLDAFVYQNYAIAEMPGTVRLGQQVVSWGESTFIGGGINSINPIDVSAFRRPGAEVKEGLIPVPMIYLSQALTTDLSLEAFYQLRWRETVMENCGTFFSRADFAPSGCNVAHIGPNVPNLVSGIPGGAGLLQGALAQLATLGYHPVFDAEGIAVPRAPDNTPRDDGQWGLSLRYFSAPLNTEFGAYAMNYHSRTPNLSAYASNLVGNPALAGMGPLGGAVLIGTSRYMMEYPEDIRLYGLSFATNLPTGTALSGEISYRPNMPVQLNAVDMLALITNGAASPAVQSGRYNIQPGTLINGYVRKEVTQAQVTAVHMWNQVLGASALTLVGEAGITRVGGLESTDTLRFGRDNVFGAGTNANGAPCAVDGTQPQCNNDGYVTRTSWGYRLRAGLDYPNVFAGVNLRPSLAFAHDVKGYSPQTGGFSEGTKAVSVGLDGEFRNTYTASIAYTNFFGGEFDVARDRDFLALSLGVNF